MNFKHMNGRGLRAAKPVRGVPVACLLAFAANLPGLLGPALRAETEASSAAGTASAPLPIDTLFKPAAVWTLTPAQVEREWMPFGFTWNDPQGVRRTARAARRDLTFLQLPVTEIVLEFQSNRLAAATLLLYSRGDGAELGPGAFEQFVGTAQGRLTGWMGRAGRPGKGVALAGAVAPEYLIWADDRHRADLEWSHAVVRDIDGKDRLRGQYVRLRLAPADPAQAAMVAAGKVPAPRPEPATVLDLRDRLVRTGSGDIKIRSLPMVIQGDRNYCVAATIERMLRYYGCILDQHQFARLTGTDARAGTGWQAMLEALHRLGPAVQMRSETLFEMRPEMLEKLVEDYNRLAQARQKPVLNVAQAREAAALYAPADLALLREARLKKPQERDRFYQAIRRQIDAGVPMLWTLIAGKVPESGLPRGTFGHMRMITGYNDQTREIIFSDTWGAQHAEKRMSVDDAWTVSFGLHVLVPRNVRY